MGQVWSLPMWIRVSRWRVISFRATMKAISLALKRKYTEEYFYLSTLPDRKTQVAQIDSVWVREVKCNGILLSANQPVITLRRITKEKIGATIATFFYTFSTGRCLGIMKSWFDYVSTPLRYSGQLWVSSWSVRKTTLKSSEQKHPLLKQHLPLQPYGS